MKLWLYNLLFAKFWIFWVEKCISSVYNILYLFMTRLRKLKASHYVNLLIWVYKVCLRVLVYIFNYIILFTSCFKGNLKIIYGLKIGQINLCWLLPVHSLLISVQIALVTFD